MGAASNAAPFLFWDTGDGLDFATRARRPPHRGAGRAYPAADAQFAADQDRRDAFIHYRQAIDKDPLLTITHPSLGEAYMSLRRFASAVQAFTRCRDAHQRVRSAYHANRRTH